MAGKGRKENLGSAADILMRFAEQSSINFGAADCHSVLDMLYDCYEGLNNFDTEEIRRDYHKIYEELEGMSLRQLDNVIDLTSTLCRNHEMQGFREGVKVGILLGADLVQ